VRGKNFVDMGFSKVKCVFNETMMNATIIDSTTIKCSSPKLDENEASLEAKYLHYNVAITLNGRERTESII
jgi:hypothetical protein